MRGVSAHAKYDFSYHVVFVPKKRRKIFGGTGSSCCRMCFEQVAQELGCKFDIIKIAVDHVHMLVMIPPKLSPSKALQVMKGRMAHMILKKFPELRLELPKSSFWARGFFARTIGELNEQLVRNYIKRTDHF